MKKYYFEAQKKQLEKPTEPLYVSCATAKCFVFAEDDAEAARKAAAKLEAEYYGTGIKLGVPHMTDCVELPVDWNYGYGDDRKAGTAADQAALYDQYVIR